MTWTENDDVLVFYKLPSGSMRTVKNCLNGRKTDSAHEGAKLWNFYSQFLFFILHYKQSTIVPGID